MQSRNSPVPSIACDSQNRTMIRSDPTQITYFTPPNPSIFPTNFSLAPTNLLDFPNYPSPNSSSLRNNSTSDEAEEHNNPTVLDERKQRRMISNRESARRSRMRKQRQLDELWAQVLRLRNDNHGLVERLNEMAENHERVVRENAKLKEEAAHLRRKLVDVQDGNSFSIFRELEEFSCNSVLLQSESSNQSIMNPSN